MYNNFIAPTQTHKKLVIETLLLKNFNNKLICGANRSLGWCRLSANFPVNNMKTTVDITTAKKQLSRHGFIFGWKNETSVLCFTTRARKKISSPERFYFVKNSSFVTLCALNIAYIVKVHLCSFNTESVISNRILWWIKANFLAFLKYLFIK